MAIEYSGAGQSHTSYTAAVTAAPYSFSCWFTTSQLSAEGILFGVNSGGASNNWAVLFFQGDVTNDPIAWGENNNSSTAFSSRNTSASANTWYHAAGVSETTTSRFAFFNGTKGAQNTSPRAPSGLSVTQIGCLSIVGQQYGFWQGRIAEAAIWSVALTDPEIAALAKGISPLRIRPQSLACYVPLVRSAQCRKGLSFTQTGSPTVAAHPRIYR